MGSKIDDLEKSINDLMEQAGIESPPSESLTTNIAAATAKRSGNVTSPDAEF